MNSTQQILATLGARWRAPKLVRSAAAFAWLFAVALVLLHASSARADLAARSPLALEPLSLNALSSFGESPITLQTVGYRPRSNPPHYGSPPHGSAPAGPGSQAQIYGGVFNPSQGSGQGFVLGFRGGPNLAPHLQLGVAMDWEHRGTQYGSVVGSSTGPGGTIVVTRQIVSSYENTFPLMAYLQLTGNPKRVLVPYVGIAGGYEIVSLSATDYASSTSFYATYGGWGWQSWGGLRVPFSPHSGLMAEVYTNQATAYRDVYDPFYGVTLRESVGLDGYGFRGGVTWGMF